MPDSNSDPNRGGAAKRSLPPSMSGSKESGSNSRRKRQDEASTPFSGLMEGVVFALSGLVNPERGAVRSQAMEMGAEYRPDWTPDCTLLVCAFPNTPKFRQVATDCGTIVSKEWISECYSQKKLVDIDSFLMNAGKPWRRNNDQLEKNKGTKDASHEEPREQSGKKSPRKLTGTATSKEKLSSTAKDHFSPSKIKEWAIADLNKTVSWLENQEEKPNADEVKAIAAEGIITCLQDTIESLEENKDIWLVMEQWMFIPHVVKELAEFESGRSGSIKASLPKKELREIALVCKRVYQTEFDRLDGSTEKKGKQKDGEDEEDDDGSDSDKTIEMTEEEIELACRELNS